VWSEITLQWLPAESATALGRYTLPGSQFCLFEHIALQVLLHPDAISRSDLPEACKNFLCIGPAATKKISSPCEIADESEERGG
jgi:hypothetical protein